MKISFVLMLFVSTLYAGERNVLVEMFTNSYCGLCPAAHTTLNQYSTNMNAVKVRYIFYHTSKYTQDALYQANTAEPDVRAGYYGNSGAVTPATFFDGVNQGTSYSAWASSLNARFTVESPLDISLSGSKNGNTISIKATLTKTGTITVTDLVVHVVAVENVDYQGGNGISPQNYVMRKMITGTGGEAISFATGSTVDISKSQTLTNITDISRTGVVVFVQSVSTKEVFQSQYIPYGTLTGTARGDDVIPLDCSLEQNYPNPFNPSTTIEFYIPRSLFVSLKVYNSLGIEAAVMIKGILEKGTYTHRFSASEFHLPSGFYFYTLEAGGRTLVRTMTLVK